MLSNLDPTGGCEVPPGPETTATTGGPAGPGPLRDGEPAPRTAGAATRVLIVDDAPRGIELLARNLARIGYEVTTAASGIEALRRIREDRPDVVLLDVLMPDISGLEVLRGLRGRAETADQPVILVSGLGETADIVEGLGLGANDYVTKPINVPVLRARIEAQASLKRARDDLKRVARLLAAENQRHEQDLKMACQVQHSILPHAPARPGGLETAWSYEPAGAVGGDLFEIVELADGRLFLFIADAMGHGVQAALVIFAVKATLAAYLRAGDDLSLLMVHLDRALGHLFDDRFITADACIIDPRARTLRHAGAGHPPLLVADRSGVRQLAAEGMPLGTSFGQDYPESQIDLEPDSTILLYTDGLIEAESADGRQFGIPALSDALSAARGQDPEGVLLAIRESLDNFRGHRPLTDDMTILLARLP